MSLLDAMTNWSDRFIKLMSNRMVKGRYRYGDINDPNQPDFDRIQSAIDRLKMYQETGNAEHLVDASNLEMIEFAVQGHPHWHFEPIDDGYHTAVRGR